MTEAVISFWTPERDSVAEATELLHRAYETYVALGIEFGAATQDEATTSLRIESATATWVARAGADLLGIISYYDHRRYGSEPEWYARDDVGHFGQFAVEPQKQGGGIGRRLLARVERRALDDEKHELACDTATALHDLVTFYVRMGFRDVGRHKWPQADFESIVLSKPLTRQR